MPASEYLDCLNLFLIILVLAIQLAVLIVVDIIKHANIVILPPVQSIYSMLTIRTSLYCYLFLSFLTRFNGILTFDS